MYLGDSLEYVVSLKLLRPQIEAQLPGIKVWISCQDEYLYLLEDELNIVSYTELEKCKSNFAYIREIRNDCTKHSILKLMEESNLKISPIAKNSKKSGMCLICPEGIQPVKSLMPSKIPNQAIIVGSDIHYSLDIKIRPKGKDKLKYIEEASWIIGVENEYLFLGAAKGIKTTLLKTGIGDKLFKEMFPDSEISINF